MAANVEIEEVIQGVQLLIGKYADEGLKKYANMLCQGYAKRFEGCAFEVL